MKVITIPCLQDNYCYLLYDETSREAALVDPSEAWPVMQVVNSKNLQLKQVLCTHHHQDHIGGLGDLLDEYQDLEVIGFHQDRSRIAHLTRLVHDDQVLEICGIEAKVMHTPGHTATSIVFQVGEHLFVGDTLFGAGCGRLFEGTAEQMLHSLDRICACAPASRVYFGHEYTAFNLRFAAQVEADNGAIGERAEAVQKLRNDNRPSAPSTLAEELKTNPFLRASESSLADYLDTIGQPAGDRLAVFTALRELRNHFS